MNEYNRGTMGYVITSVGILTALALSGTAFADTQTTSASAPLAFGGMHHGMMGGHGVFGKVSAITGTTLTITQTNPRDNTTTTYTVDGTNASVTKDGAASSLAAIVVGDTVMVQGTVSGTAVTATKINDGMPKGMGKGMWGGRGPGGQGGPQASIIQGNGEPVVGGSVTGVSGSTVTITNASNITYSVDASSAVVEKDHATSSVSAIATGDQVVVQGTVNGTSITASSIMDNGTVPAQGAQGQGMGARRGGFMGFFGNIFHRLFGFF